MIFIMRIVYNVSDPDSFIRRLKAGRYSAYFACDPCNGVVGFGSAGPIPHARASNITAGHENIICVAPDL